MTRKSGEHTTHLRLVVKAMRRSKRQALRSGLLVSTDIATYIVNDTLSFRGRDCDNAVWYALALRVAGSTREQEHDDGEDQGVFDLSMAAPIKVFQFEAELPDGRMAVKRASGWVIKSDDGDGKPVKDDEARTCERRAEPHYINTKIVELRNFSVSDGDQHTVQLRENLDRNQIAYDRWSRGWKIIRPLLLTHPLWTLGHAVDDLRSRGEWPEDLDEE